MWSWFRRPGMRPRNSPDTDALKGAPAHARVKTFSAETGFVYQYVYRGHRRTSDGRGSEHVFEASRDRIHHFPISIEILDAELALCVAAIGRDLIGAEHYALVKMTLFAALNEFVDPAELQKPLVPKSPQMEQHLQSLGRI